MSELIQMVVNVVECGARSDGTDAIPALRIAIEKLHCFEGSKKLIFTQGSYDFWPDRAEEAYLFTSNNDSGLKRIAFNIIDLSDLEIDGQGSAFIFHGQITPFSITGSDNISLKSFSVDFKRPFHNEALIISSSNGFVDLAFDIEEFPYKIVDDQLLFKLEDGETFGGANILEFDTVKRETAVMAPRNYDFYLKPLTRAEELSPGVVRIFANFDEPRPQKGNTLVFGSPHRNCPGIFCDSSENLKISNVTIHHAGGMGLLAQRCEGIRVERLSVTPSGKRIVSTSADATHFVNCRGQVELIDCLLENQMDDPGNFHGIYAQITKILSPTELEVRLVHHQQRGFPFIEARDLAEIIDSRTLLALGVAPVKTVKHLNKEYMNISLERSLPNGVKVGDSVGNVSWGADVTIRGCTTRGNRARGFLISTPGKVMVEDNSFHNEGPSIQIDGDANYWFESGAVRDVTIRRNKFHNCNYGYRGVAVIQVTPGVAKDIDGPVPYHRGIRIEDNNFTTFSRQLLYARCVDGISFTRNEIERSDIYPCLDKTGYGVTLDGCINVSVEGNSGGKGWPIVMDGVQAGTLENSVKM